MGSCDNLRGKKFRLGGRVKTRPYPLVLLALALLGCAPSDNNDNGAKGENEIAIVNPGFEEPARADGEIPGWEKAQHAGPVSYEMSVDTEVRSRGRASFRIARKREQFYGQIAQVVPIAAYAGRTIELSAQMKTDDVGPKGWQLMLTFTGGVRNPRHSAPPLTDTQDFRKITIRTQVPQGAQGAEIAATLLDRGTAWLDDVHINVVEP